MGSLKFMTRNYANVPTFEKQEFMQKLIFNGRYIVHKDFVKDHLEPYLIMVRWSSLCGSWGAEGGG